MNQVCLSSNVVIIYHRHIVDDFNTNTTEEQIKNVFGDQDHQPEVGSANIPNQLKTAFSPSDQVQVVAQQNSLIITTSEINETNEAGNTNFLRLSHKLNQDLKNKHLESKHFGFNYIFNLQAENINSLVETIKSKFIKTNIVRGSEELIYALPTYSYKDRNIQYSFRYEVEIDESSKPIKINVSVNVNDPSDAFPDDVAELIEMYQNAYQYIYNKLGVLNS